MKAQKLSLFRCLCTGEGFFFCIKDKVLIEPACGDGNFLAEILGRKLSVVKERYQRSAFDWERNALLALGSLYGVDILSDNCEVCRERLMKICLCRNEGGYRIRRINPCRTLHGQSFGDQDNYPLVR